MGYQGVHIVYTLWGLVEPNDYWDLASPLIHHPRD